MLKTIIVFATILVAVAMAMQPLEDNERHHHLNHKRQLSQHHQKFQEVRHSAKDHIQNAKALHQVVSHAKEHRARGQSSSQRKSRQAHKEQDHKKSHHKKEHHSRKSRSHPEVNKHHKRHSGSRRH
ncbi:histidine-rich glycoprotein [Drosophila eugracilis]|uniref:histidine-rich glycoprotein n=1 Tax=Drosophila eugracilis TaxID=29029 RepID=UPI0007E7C22E|nr:histidine-rich glycoprotein [Drosophila eugracilis]